MKSNFKENVSVIQFELFQQIRPVVLVSIASKSGSNSTHLLKKWKKPQRNSKRELKDTEKHTTTGSDWIHV